MCQLIWIIPRLLRITDRMFGCYYFFAEAKTIDLSASSVSNTNSILLFEMNWPTESDRCYLGEHIESFWCTISKDESNKRIVEQKVGKVNFYMKKKPKGHIIPKSTIFSVTVDFICLGFDFRIRRVSHANLSNRSADGNKFHRRPGFPYQGPARTIGHNRVGSSSLFYPVAIRVVIIVMCVMCHVDPAAEVVKFRARTPDRSIDRLMENCR